MRPALHLLRSGLLTAALAVSACLAAYELPAGVYILGNHPDGTFNPAGERLYGLVMTDFAGESRILFDFEHPDADMRMTVNRNKVFIHGTAIARVQVDGAWVERDAWQISFTYRDNLAIVADGGMDDYVVTGSGSNTGSLTNTVSGEHFPLVEVARSDGETFRLGDNAGAGIRMAEHADALLAEPGFNTDYADGPGNGGGGSDEPTDGEDPTPPPAVEAWLDEAENPDPTAKPRDFLFSLQRRVGHSPSDG